METWCLIIWNGLIPSNSHHTCSSKIYLNKTFAYMFLCCSLQGTTLFIMFLLFLQRNNTLGVFSRTTLPFSCEIIPSSSQPHFIDSPSWHEVHYFYEDKNYGFYWSELISFTLQYVTRQFLDDILFSKGTQLFLYYFTALFSVEHDIDWSS